MLLAVAAATTIAGETAAAQQEENPRVSMMKNKKRLTMMMVSSNKKMKTKMKNKKKRKFVSSEEEWEEMAAVERFPKTWSEKEAWKKKRKEFRQRFETLTSRSEKKNALMAKKAELQKWREERVARLRESEEAEL